MLEFDIKNINKFKTVYQNSKTNKIVENVLSTTNVLDVALDNDKYISRVFKYRVDPKKLENTDQQSSGRCWIFGSTNMLRRRMIKKYKITSNFELSQKFIMFYDKLEKCNTLIETMYYFSKQDKNADSLELSYLRKDIIEDGGTWDYFIKIVEKYGIVPKEFYPENEQSSDTTDMNTFLLKYIKSFSKEIENLAKGLGVDVGTENSENSKKCLDAMKGGKKSAAPVTFSTLKNAMLYKCFEILVKFLGMPPDTIKWSYYSSSKTNNELYTSKPECTTLDFYNNYIKPVANLKDFIVLINDPRNTCSSVYTTQYYHNVLDNDGVDKQITNKFLNVKSSVMREAIIKSIKNNYAVPFSADVSQYFLIKSSKLTTDIYSEDFLGYPLNISKDKMFESVLTSPNHLMLFIGCNEIGNGLEVENSWNAKYNSNQYIYMSDDWFNKFVGSIVIHKKFIDKSLLDSYNKAIKKGAITYYPFWDVFSTVA